MAEISQPITAKNATEHSVRAAFNQATAKELRAPSIKGFEQETIKQFDILIKANKENIQLCESLKKKKSRFSEILHIQKLPDNLTIIPILIHPNPRPNEYNEAKLEYKSRVRAQYIKTIATHNKDDLQNRGVSKHVIKLMEKGEILQNTFSADIHHIIESAMCGSYLVKKEADNNNPYNKSQTHLVNHFNNLILIPTKAHRLINEFREIQSNIYTSKKPHYILMLVPKIRLGNNHFMMPLQSNVEKYGIEIKNDKEVIKEFIKHLKESPTKKLFAKEISRAIISCITDDINEHLENINSGNKNKQSSIQYLTATYTSQDIINIYDRAREDLRKPEARNFVSALNQVNQALYISESPTPKQNNQNNLTY